MIRGFTVHVLLLQVEVVAELYKEADRNIEYTLPNIVTYFNRSSDAPPAEVVINQTASQAVFYNVTIKGLDIPVMAYTAHLVSRECKGQASGKMILTASLTWHSLLLQTLS